MGNTQNELIDALDNPDAFSMTALELETQLRPVFGDRTDEVIDTFRNAYPRANNYVLYSTIAMTHGTPTALGHGCSSSAQETQTILEL